MMEQAAVRPGNAATESTSGVTVEHLLFGAVAAIAIGMRFIGLANAPLTPAEAAMAWASQDLPVPGGP